MSRSAKWVLAGVTLTALLIALGVWLFVPPDLVTPTRVDPTSPTADRPHHHGPGEEEEDAGEREPQPFEVLVVYEDGGVATNIDVVLSSVPDDEANQGAPVCDECHQVFGSCADPFRAKRYVAAHKPPTPIDHAPTNEEGIAHFAPLRPTAVRVTAMAPGLFGSVVARSGESAELTLSPPAKAEIRITDVMDKPIVGADVTLFDVSAGTTSVTRTDGKGLASAVMPSTNVLFLAEAPGFLPGAVYGAQLEEPVGLMLEVPHRLVIRTTLAGQPVEADVTLGPIDYSEDAYGDVAMSAHVQRVRATQGIARFENLPGRPLRIEARSGEYVARAADLTLFKAETFVDLELRARGTVSVVIINEQGEADETPLDISLSDNNENRHRSGPMQQRFEFTDVPEGDYRLNVDAEDYRSVSQRLSVHPGNQTVEVMLKKQLKLEGMVVDANGKPVADAELQIRTDELLAMEDGLGTSSDSDGHFVLPLPEAGKYRLVARHIEEGNGEATVTAPSTGVVIKLTTRAHFEAVFVDDRGAPVSGAYVMVNAPSVRLFHHVESNEQGVAKFGSVGGLHLALTAMSEGHLRFDAQADVAAEGTTRVTYHLVPKSSIEGTVVDETGRPAPETRNWYISCGDLMCGGADLRAGPDATSKFRIDEVPAGVKVTISAQDGMTGESGPPVVVTPPATGVRLVLPKPQQVHGRVVDGIGQPLAEFEVNGISITSPDGRFQVETSPARGLSLSAEGFTAKGIEVTATTTDVGTIVLERMGHLVGIVVDEAGRPVGAATVDASCLYGAAVQTRGDGRFDGLCDADEPVQVNASRGGTFGSATAQLGKDVTIRLSGGTRVVGKLLDQDGKPRGGVVSYSSPDRLDARDSVEAGPDGAFSVTLAPGSYGFWARGAPPVVFLIQGPQLQIELRAATSLCALTLRGPGLTSASFFSKRQLSPGVDPEAVTRAGLAQILEVSGQLGVASASTVLCGPGTFTACFETGCVTRDVEVGATTELEVAAPQVTPDPK